jgi:hypothetical protein
MLSPYAGRGEEEEQENAEKREAPMNVVEEKAAVEGQDPAEHDQPLTRPPEPTQSVEGQVESGGDEAAQAQEYRRQQHPAPTNAPRRSRRQLRIGVGIVAVVAILAVAFYSGTVYQGGIDQNVLAQYYPAQTSGNRAGTGGGATDQQAAAALSGGAPSTSAGAGSAGGASATGAGVTPPASGSTATLAGQWVAAGPGTVAVKSFQGQQSATTTSGTHYYQVAAASQAALAVGQQVDIAPVPGDAATAAGVTIAPAKDLLVSVRSFGGGTGARGGSSGSGGSGGAGGFAGSGGSGVAGGARRAGTTGTVSALGNGTLTLRTAQGASQTVKLTSATKVYRVTATTRASIAAGTYVAVRAARVNGKPTATDVVAAPAGTTATIVTPGSGAP